MWQGDEEKLIMRSYMICALHQIYMYYGYEIKWDEMGGIYRTQGIDEKS
jgi:hypothetical protein